MPILTAKNLSELLGISLGAAKAKLRRSAKAGNCRPLQKNKSTDTTYYDIPIDLLTSILLKKAYMLKNGISKGESNLLKNSLSHVRQHLIIMNLEIFNKNFEIEKLKNENITLNKITQNIYIKYQNNLNINNNNNIKIELLKQIIGSKDFEIEKFKESNDALLLYIKKLERNALFYRRAYLKTQISFFQKFVMIFKKAK